MEDGIGSLVVVLENVEQNKNSKINIDKNFYKLQKIIRFLDSFLNE